MAPRLRQRVDSVAKRHKALVWAAIALGALLAIAALTLLLPKWSFLQPSGNLAPADRAKAESDLRGHLIQVLGGIVLVVGAVYTARTFALNREGQITERFTRAVEQLANDDKLDIRLGGIYALERIAHDSTTHYDPVTEVLSAFLREHSPQGLVEFTPEGKRVWPEWEEIVERNRVDVYAVATVLGRRDRRREPSQHWLNLVGVDLRRALLPEADFNKASLSSADFREAYLEGTHFCDADLSCADFRGCALHRADFRNAHLQEANLLGVWIEEADLSGADLRRSNLRRANLRGANLSKADLRDADLSKADLSGADLRGAELSTTSGLEKKQLDRAITNELTKLPDRVPDESDRSS